MSRATYQEPIRRSTIIPAFAQSLAEVHFQPHTDFASLQVFTCDRLSCVLTKEACAANYTRSNAPISCKGCPIGAAHAGDAPMVTGRHTNAEAAIGLSCIRCERNERTATRYIGRFRLTRARTLCLNCFNREREVVRGYNAKGAAPVRWAHLKQATVTIQDAAGDRKTLDIGLRSGRDECERFVARIHPGCSLVEVFIGGLAVQPGEVDPTPADWKSERTRKGHETKAARKQKPLAVASDHEAARNIDASRATAAKPFDWDDWDTPLYAKSAPSDESDSDGSGQARRCGWLPPMSAEDDEAYRQSFDEPALDPESIAAYWDGMNADGLPEFIEWLCEGWTEPAEPSAPVEYLSEVTGNPWTGFIVTKRPIGEPTEPPATVSDAVALPEAAEPVSEPQDKPAEATKPTVDPEAISAPVRDPIAEAISKLQAAEEVRPLTRKERREYARLEAKIARKQLRAAQQTVKHMPAKQTAIAARAYALLQVGN